jgi:hypothetical protein
LALAVHSRRRRPQFAAQYREDYHLAQMLADSQQKQLLGQLSTIDPALPAGPLRICPKLPQP